MIIQNNIVALNAYNRLSGNNSLVSKNLKKLSSGYKINRAGDDAADLAISEKMRAQITELERATNNAKDGISLIQTAEGALTEVHAMLNRMVDLATQASNGTYDNDADRANLQKEVQALKDEINRIASSTSFNGIKLLDGSLGGGATAPVAEGAEKGLHLQIGDTADKTVKVTVNDMSATALGLDGVSVATEQGAADSIALLKTAINTVSGTRTDLGVIQTRLEYTVNNLTTTTENMANAESSIRDTDAAKEKTAGTKDNALSQAMQAMLAQANKQPQIQLLR